MALINCPKCGKEISDKAKQCVGCGWKVDLDILNTKQNESVSRDTSSKIEMSHNEEERNKMLKNAELEIEKVKENARQKIKSINESAKAMVTQKQKELELEYRKKEKELAQQKEFLEKAQIELERTKKEQTADLQYIEKSEKKMSFSSVNALFMLIAAVIMICFMVIVWRRLDKFSTEIDFLVSNNNQINSRLPENVLVEELESTVEQEDISNGDLENENGVDEIIDNEETEIASESVENAIAPNENVASVENSSVSFEYTGNDIKFNKVYIYIKISNTGKTPIFLTSQKFHYINDVSIEKYYSELDTEILSGKSSLLEIQFSIDKLKAAGVSTIDSFTYQYNTAEDADSKDLIPGEITFNELGITY